MKADGSLVLIVELTAYESAYTVKMADKKVVFEKDSTFISTYLSLVVYLFVWC